MGLFIGIGMLSSNLLGLTLGDPDKLSHFFELRLMFAMPAVPCIIRFFVFLIFFRFETPTYLISQKKNEEAK